MSFPHIRNQKKACNSQISQPPSNPNGGFLSHRVPRVLPQSSSISNDGIFHEINPPNLGYPHDSSLCPYATHGAGIFAKMFPTQSPSHIAKSNRRGCHIAIWDGKWWKHGLLPETLLSSSVSNDGDFPWNQPTQSLWKIIGKSSEHHRFSYDFPMVVLWKILTLEPHHPTTQLPQLPGSPTLGRRRELRGAPCCVSWTACVCAISRNHRKVNPVKPWENHGKTMGKPWENHGNMVIEGGIDGFNGWLEVFTIKDSPIGLF